MEDVSFGWLVWVAESSAGESGLAFDVAAAIIGGLRCRGGEPNFAMAIQRRVKSFNLNGQLHDRDVYTL
jgi:phosphomevalonate kinase